MYILPSKHRSNHFNKSRLCSPCGFTSWLHDAHFYSTVVDGSQQKDSSQKETTWNKHARYFHRFQRIIVSKAQVFNPRRMAQFRVGAPDPKLPQLMRRILLFTFAFSGRQIKLWSNRKRFQSLLVSPDRYQSLEHKNLNKNFCAKNWKKS